MRVQLVGVLWGVKTDVFASHHLMYVWGKSHVVNNLRNWHRSLTLNGFTRRRCCPHLSQEVLLRVLVKRRNCASGPEPRVHSDFLFVSFAEAAVIREADVFFQLWYLRERRSNKITLTLIPLTVLFHRILAGNKYLKMKGFSFLLLCLFASGHSFSHSKAWKFTHRSNRDLNILTGLITWKDPLNEPVRSHSFTSHFCWVTHEQCQTKKGTLFFLILNTDWTMWESRTKEAGVKTFAWGRKKRAKNLCVHLYVPTAAESF